ncbi:MAG: hypothetical protein JO053_09390 [Acidobacteria bacterium]|nr:hypothetical protein [Acidobacteriota bacterium]
MKLTVALLLCIIAIGCDRSHGVDLDAFVVDLDSLTKDMCDRIAAEDVAGARAAFDAKKAALKTQFDAIQKVPRDQYSKSDQTKVTDCIGRDMQSLMKEVTAHRLRVLTAANKAKSPKVSDDLDEVEKLYAEWLGLFDYKYQRY